MGKPIHHRVDLSDPNAHSVERYSFRIGTEISDVDAYAVCLLGSRPRLDESKRAAAG